MKNSFNSMIKITWMIIGVCAVALISIFYRLLIQNEDLGDWFFLLFSIPILILSFIALVFMYNLRRAYSLEQTAIYKGTYLAHWTYEEVEWNLFNKAEWRRSRKRAIVIPLACIGFFLFVGILDTEFREEVLPVVAPWIIGFLGSLSMLLLFYLYALYKRTWTSPREVYIGHDGILYGGFYTSWSGVGTKLGKVQMVTGTTLTLEFEVLIWGRYSYNSHPVRILVPVDRKAEAEEVINKLSC